MNIYETRNDLSDFGVIWFQKFSACCNVIYNII